MQFSYFVDKTIPPLSWCVHLKKNSTAVEVNVGSDVYCSQEFFAEGCWAGEFSATGLENACVSSAAGAVIKNSGLLVSGTTNTLARLYAFKKNDDLWVSNSLAFILTASRQELDINYLFYCEDFISIIDGLDKYKPTIPTIGKENIEIYYHCDLNISKDLSITVQEKPACPQLDNFDAYHQFLLENIRMLFENAKSNKRKTLYLPITTLSKGYDSPTCAVLAMKNGCNEAITFFDPDSSDPHSDSGTAIAKVLGMKIHEVSRTAYRDLEKEHEFLSVGTGGEDAFFAPLENLLHNRILVTGFHGDKVWDCNNTKISSNIVRGDPSGADLEEFRLRTGFIHVAVPFFGCRSQFEINAISHSDEMQAWRLNNEYDRPICRRICESAEIPREIFGQRKMVMSRSFANKRERFEWYFGEISLNKFINFTKKNNINPRSSERILNRIWHFGKNTSDITGRFSYKARNLIDKVFSPLDIYSNPLDESKLIFFWAVSLQQEAYKNICTENADEISPY